MPGLGSAILDACKKAWDESFIKGTKNSANCSGFVQDVATTLALPLSAGNADAIVDEIASNWTKLDSASAAAQKAGTGFLVIAGLKSTDHTPARGHGHVAIVVEGPLYRGKYPLCWGGSTGGAQSQGTKSTGEVWSSVDRDNVGYYAHQIPMPKATPPPGP